MSAVQQLPARLRAARRASKVNRAVVAVALGRSTETLAAYETGRVMPPLPVLEQLAEHYQTTLADLLAQDGEA
jgi:transcriptional regulator with XRE-family HTH domain